MGARRITGRKRGERQEDIHDVEGRYGLPGYVHDGVRIPLLAHLTWSIDLSDEEPHLYCTTSRLICDVNCPFLSRFGTTCDTFEYETAVSSSPATDTSLLHAIRGWGGVMSQRTISSNSSQIFIPY